jgi:hypothetical protein
VAQKLPAVQLVQLVAALARFAKKPAMHWLQDDWVDMPW